MWLYSIKDETLKKNMLTRQFFTDSFTAATKSCSRLNKLVIDIYCIDTIELIDY